LRDRDPVDIPDVGLITVGVSLGEDINVVISWSYVVSSRGIDDRGSFYEDIASWWHNIDYDPDEEVIKPGFEFTVSPPITGKQKWEITIQFGRRILWWEEFFKGTVIITLTLKY
jgi:hypothetical protein